MEEKTFGDLIIQTNGWYITDDSCFQYCKELGNHCYHFIQEVWLDTCKGDEGYPDKEYVIQEDIIDLKDYSEEDMKIAIQPYGFSTLEEFWKSNDQEQGEELIAEYIFEEDCYNVLDGYGMLTEKEAQKNIIDFIRNN